jgi:hypothetical protein
MNDQIEDIDLSGDSCSPKSRRTSSRRSRLSLRNLRGSWSLCSIPEDEAALPKFNQLTRRHSRHSGDLYVNREDHDNEENVFHRSPVTAANGYKPSLVHVDPETVVVESSPCSLETLPDVASIMRSEDRSSSYFLYNFLQLLSSVVQNFVIFSAYVCCAACWTISAFLTSYFIQRQFQNL